MIRLAIIILTCVLLLAGQLYANTDQPIELKRDPFKRVLNTDSLLARGGLDAIKEKAEATFKVKGVLLGQSSSMANINGKILAIGDLIDGYRLISVDLEKAVLEKDSILVEILTDEKK